MYTVPHHGAVLPSSTGLGRLAAGASSPSPLTSSCRRGRAQDGLQGAGGAGWRLLAELVQEAVLALADQDEARLAEFDVVVIDVANWVLDAAHDGICTASAVQVRVHMHAPTFAL